MSRQPNQFARPAFLDVPVALYRTTPAGAILDANPALADLLGFPDVESLLRVDVRNLYVDPAVRERCRSTIELNGHVMGFEQELHHFTGRTIWVHDNSRVVRSPDGGIAYYEGALVNITPRLRALDALEHSEERYRTLFRRCPVPLWEEDLSAVEAWIARARRAGVSDVRRHLDEHPETLREVIELVRIVDVNEAAVALIGADSKADVVGGVPRALLSEGAVNAFRDQVVAVAEGVKRLGTEFTGRTLRGRAIECRLDWVVAPQQGLQPLSRVVVAITDVTESRANEQRLQALLRSKDEFIASVSHELRTPITTVAGFALELSERWDDVSPGDRREFTDLIATQSVAVANLIEDLLVAARLDAGALRMMDGPCDLSDQINLVMTTLPSARDLEIELDCCAVCVSGDAIRVRQIIRNLVSNAARHGGSKVEISVVTTDGFAVLRVSDNGPGVDAGDAERIFDLYDSQTTDVSRPGSLGVGLFVARGLARKMGGDLVYEPSKPRSAFILTLPLSKPV